MAAFSSARRSENARSSSLCNRSSTLRSTMVRSRAARSAPRRSVSRTALSGATGPLFLNPAPLGCLCAQIAFPLARLPRLLAQGVARRLRLRHRGRRRRQLLDALLEVRTVGDDHVELTVQHVQHGAMLRAQRPQARRALSLRTEALDLVALILDLLVLLEQLGAARIGVFLLTDPCALLLLRDRVRRFQAFGERAGLGARPRERCLGVAQLRDAAIQHVQIPCQLGELRLLLAPRGVFAVQALELHELRFQLGDGRDLGVELAQLLACGERLGQLLVQPLKLLARDHHTLLGHAQVAVQGERALAPLDPLLPARLFLRQGLLRPGAIVRGGGRGLAGADQPPFRRLALFLELGLGRQTRLQAVHFMAERVAALADALLRDRELLVAQHPREERGALGARGVREHRQLLLTGEIRVEEFIVRHAKHALQAARHLFQGIGDDDAVLMELGIAEAPFHAVGVGAEPEFQLHAHRRARLGAQVADRVFVAARRRIAVDDPRDRLEQRCLARAVGADDPGDAVTKHDFGIGVLAEIDEPQPLQLHGEGGSAVSRYSTPTFTNVSRFSSASSGRRPRKSRTVSVSVWRLAPAPAAPSVRWDSWGGRRRSSWKFNARAL